MRRRVLVAGLAATAVTVFGVVASCGSGQGGGGVPTPTASRHIALSSTAFRDGGTIPRRYTCDGEDVSPPLALSGVPAHTASLVLLVEDPDAARGPFAHWLVWNMDPHTTRLLPGQAPPGAVQGRNSFTKAGYSGPCPPMGAPHHYVFTVYAVDRRLAPPSGATADDLRRAVNGHALALGTLTGRYGR
ncbi:YbhB/YbcL family Raf kinase inhibitor-like protein [Streptomyces tropicalis]|uniref:YbhB/YbcL family Raf kinase inhibitor-like protein n=1 Tax=Streptomyces tropicalis TaxID=3034234 RepID=A0ABT6A3U3_9ACTN|nr:YbhB/YbcL family Raf kinase inhibitor-like protein [Streptomyces tropicalis]MDF3298475.1 YbhB/YbcL family Raf kinase inhibitor-like protein [Streptomyces tropicalis]